MPKYAILNMYAMIVQAALAAQRTLPTDGGPIYSETDTSRFIVEPWNAWSSLFILFPAIYWAFKLRGRYREYPFITFCIPLLFLGGLGSTLYHAFRNSRLLLLLDVTPTAVLTLSLAIYFWIKMLPKWWWVIPIIGISIILRAGGWYYLPGQAGVNVSYAITGATLLIPSLLLLYQTRLAHSHHIFISTICFILSLVFRQADNWQISLLPMGTHFLWHIFSGIGAFFLAEYLYKIHLIDRELKA